MHESQKGSVKQTTPEGWVYGSDRKGGVMWPTPFYSFLLEKYSVEESGKSRGLKRAT